MKPTEMIGNVFGLATPLARVPNEKSRHPKFLCRCDCGSEFLALGYNLRSGHTRSCGCYRAQQARESHTTHGATRGVTKGTKPMSEHRIWCQMKSRCHQPKNRSYHRYGARGIYVCDEWRGSFETFLADMGPRPSPKHTLDRRENDGPYAKWNCRWATATEQANNTRRNRVLVVQGKAASVSGWARESGVPAGTVRSRLDAGWEAEQAVFTPAKRTTTRYLQVQGVRKTAWEWAAVAGISYQCLIARLNAGWPPEKAIFTPLRKQ